MQVRTRAIVLHLTRISDNKSVLHLFTRECGRVQYIVYGNRRKQHALLPLSPVEIEAEHRDNRELQTLKEIVPTRVSMLMNSDICRQTEALFMAEVLFRTLTHPLAEPSLYDWLEEVVQALDERPNPENVHLEFLVGLIDWLGFGIDMQEEKNKRFALIGSGAVISNEQRRELLHALMEYYAVHLADFHEPKSLDVMTEVFAV